MPPLMEVLMKNNKRALRRSHQRRMKKHAMKVFPDWPYAKFAANHLQICSCAGCGNRRKDPWLNKRERLTPAERRWHDYADAQEEPVQTSYPVPYFEEFIENERQNDFYNLYSDWDYYDRSDVTEEEWDEIWDQGIEWWNLWEVSEGE
jgi:hypothetical protein